MWVYLPCWHSDPSTQGGHWHVNDVHEPWSMIQAPPLAQGLFRQGFKSESEKKKVESLNLSSLFHFLNPWSFIQLWFLSWKTVLFIFENCTFVSLCYTECIQDKLVQFFPKFSMQCESVKKTGSVLIEMGIFIVMISHILRKGLRSSYIYLAVKGVGFILFEPLSPFLMINVVIFTRNCSYCIMYHST